jgi:hypothetical protein
MNDRPQRNWAAARQAQERVGELQQLMSHLLNLFESGCLVYRNPVGGENRRSLGVSTKSDRLKRVRALLSGPAVVTS